MGTPRVLVKFKGKWLTYPEIAERTGLPLHIVKSRVNHGRSLNMPLQAKKGCALGAKARVVMFEGKRRTYREISLMTGVPIGTVKSRVHYGRPLGAPVNYHMLEPVDPLAGLVESSVHPKLPYERDAMCREVIAERGAMTLDQIGHLLGVTRQRVQQIEAKALRKLAKRGVSRRQLERLRDEQDYARSIRDARESGYRRRAA